MSSETTQRRKGSVFVIIEKSGIQGKGNNEYKAKVIFSENRTDIVLYLVAEHGEVRVKSDFFLNEPNEEIVVSRIKLLVKSYERKVSEYPNLDKWDGKIY